MWNIEDEPLPEPFDFLEWADPALDGWLGTWWDSSSSVGLSVHWAYGRRLLSMQRTLPQGRFTLYVGLDASCRRWVAHKIMVTRGRAAESFGFGHRIDGVLKFDLVNDRLQERLTLGCVKRTPTRALRAAPAPEGQTVFFRRNASARGDQDQLEIDTWVWEHSVAWKSESVALRRAQ